VSSDNRLIFFGFLGQNLRSEISAKLVDLFVFFLPTDPTFLFKYAQRGTWLRTWLLFYADICLKPLCPDVGLQTLGSLQSSLGTS
jgi:hypothetical protein